MTLRQRLRVLVPALAAALILAGCMTRAPAPVDERGPVYLVPPPQPPNQPHDSLEWSLQLLADLTGTGAKGREFAQMDAQ